MKRKMMTVAMMAAMMLVTVTGCGDAKTTADGGNASAADGTVYKVGIVQYVDDASLNQIEKAI